MMCRSKGFNSKVAAGWLLALLAVCAGGRLLRAQSTSSAPVNPPAPTQSAPVAEQKPGLLADCVPGNVMLYVEIRGLKGVIGDQVGAGMVSDLLDVLKGSATSAPAAKGATAPANEPGLKHIFAAAIGLGDSQAAGQLFSGPLAIAADGWSGLSDAVLIARPLDPAALEARLADRRVAGAPGKTRRYELNGNNVLACDGQSVVVGRAGKRAGLLARTVEILERGGKGSLAEQVEFRERTAVVPTNSQLALYIGKADAGASAGPDPLTAWWPEDWPQPKTVALGMVLGREGATIKVSTRLDPEGPQLTRSEPPIQMIRQLPTSVLGGWTQAINYISGYRQLRAKYSQDADGLRWEALEASLEPGIIEKRFLGHLVGDTVLTIDRIVVRPTDATHADEQIVLPTCALMVETDDPDAVAGVLAPLANNLMRVLNSPPSTQPAVTLRAQPVTPGGPVMYVLPLGQMWAGKSRCDLMAGLELCVTVANRWLIVGTHPLAVQKLVEQRRGPAGPLAIADLDAVMERVAGHGGQTRRVMFAEPHAIGAMIETWIEHLERHHPEMLQAQWWDKLLRRQRAMGKQLGILVRPANGTVEVVDALPGGPARDRLQPGDRILAADGIKVDPATPLKSLREYVAGRAEADRIVLLVRRGNETREVILPLPSDSAAGNLQSPIDLLKRFAELSKLFSSASYVLWQSRPDVVEARIDLRYFAGSVPPPATQPAHQ